MRLFVRVHQKFRRMKYSALSDCSDVSGKPYRLQPVQLTGDGSIRFGPNVVLGFYPSPFFLNGYIYIEARSSGSVVEFGENVIVNNNCVFISDGPGIYIGKNTMFGTNCEVLDSDFHSIRPERHEEGMRVKTGKVVIGENVMIGSNVRILRGVSIGDNSVIANGAVVTRSMPPNTLAFGNPAKGGPLTDMLSST